jgi:hypothetical protein
MRRVVTILLILGLAVPFLAGCCSTCRNCEYKVPNMAHRYVVGQDCYPVDYYGNPYPKAAP